MEWKRNNFTGHGSKSANYGKRFSSRSVNAADFKIVNGKSRIFLLGSNTV